MNEVNDKTCGNCWWFHEESGRCARSSTDKVDGSRLCCGGFVPNKIKTTVFRKITESPETLVEHLVYWDQNPPNSGWTSSLIRCRVYRTKPEAIAATVAKLKEVADE